MSCDVLLCSFRSRDSVVVMPKFQRQTTHANEPDILHIIDERFEELEETVALARLIPQIHDRLFDVEQMLKRLEAVAKESYRLHSSTA